MYKALQQNQKTCAIPFIFLSARSNPGEVRKGMNLGADDYITKPFDEEDLILAVEKRPEKREQIFKSLEAPKKRFKLSSSYPENATALEQSI